MWNLPITSKLNGKIINMPSKSPFILRLPSLQFYSVCENFSKRFYECCGNKYIFVYIFLVFAFKAFRSRGTILKYTGKRPCSYIYIFFICQQFFLILYNYASCQLSLFWYFVEARYSHRYLMSRLSLQVFYL
jgi:hypothetical protein